MYKTMTFWNLKLWKEQLFIFNPHGIVKSLLSTPWFYSTLDLILNLLGFDIRSNYLSANLGSEDCLYVIYDACIHIPTHEAKIWFKVGWVLGASYELCLPKGVSNICLCFIGIDLQTPLNNPSAWLYSMKTRWNSSVNYIIKKNRHNC